MQQSFGSDNQSGVHPEVLAAIAAANSGHQPAYGADAISSGLKELFSRSFDADLEVFLVFTGTAANTLAIRSSCASYEAVLATDIAHIVEDECGAPAWLGGNTIITCPHRNGKMQPEAIENLRLRPQDPHRVMPRLVSITQASELGTVYTPAEVRALTERAHERGLLVHMDGARLANAAAFLGSSLADITSRAGVDILSFGGTKNGLLAGEALVFFRPELARAFPYYRKQAAQLASKMRFLSSQFYPYLAEGLWLRNAERANSMARYLRSRLAEIEGASFPYPTEANEVFVQLPEDKARVLAEKSGAYVWEQRTGLLRLVTSFDTDSLAIDALAESLS